MCLAIPGKIVSIDKESNSALIDFDGLKQTVIIALIMNPEVGKYVVVHAGYAIEQMSEEIALEAIEQWKEIAENQDISLDNII
ncbi:MAG: HypC/HybG/HupF family hydrogenase formation chaperone [Promethearchaeota archaeon]